MRSQRLIKAIDASAITATSLKYYIGDALRVGILVRAAAVTSGNGVLSVKGSLEQLDAGGGPKDNFGYQTGLAGVTVIAVNCVMDNVTNTNAQNITRTNGTTISATGDKIVWLDPNMLLNWLEVTMTRTTDGTYSAYIIVETENPSSIR